MQLQEILIDTATGRVLSTGCVSWAANTHFDPAIHTIVRNEDFVFDPAIYDPDTKTETPWYWDGSTFTQTAP